MSAGAIGKSGIGAGAIGKSGISAGAIGKSGMGVVTYINVCQSYVPT